MIKEMCEKRSIYPLLFLCYTSNIIYVAVETILRVFLAHIGCKMSI